jgi:UDP-N-acetyl-D-mannosaminuronate dehydrogenase
LQAKIAGKSATVAVCGMAMWGSALMVIAEHGFSVIGFDIDDDKVASSIPGGLHPAHPVRRHRCDVAIAALPRDRQFQSDRRGRYHNGLRPHSLNKYREPDLSYVVSTAQLIAKNARPGQLVILESTTYRNHCGGAGPDIFKMRALPGKMFFLLLARARIPAIQNITGHIQRSSAAKAPSRSASRARLRQLHQTVTCLLAGTAGR